MSSKSDKFVSNVDEIRKKTEVYDNFMPKDMIITNSEKVEICLNNYKNALTAKKDWLLPFGILVSLLTSLGTSNFKDAFGLPSNVWEAIYIVLSLVMAGWFALDVYHLVKYYEKSEVSYLIEQLKKPSGK